jgi:hypothetical protein
MIRCSPCSLMIQMPRSIYGEGCEVHRFDAIDTTNPW